MRAARHKIKSDHTHAIMSRSGSPNGSKKFEPTALTLSQRAELYLTYIHKRRQHEPDRMIAYATGIFVSNPMLLCQLCVWTVTASNGKGECIYELKWKNSACEFHGAMSNTLIA